VVPAKALLAQLDNETRGAAELREALASGDHAAIRSRTSSLARVALTAEAISQEAIDRIMAPAKEPAVKVSGKATANGAMRALRVLWNWQADRVPDLPANPVSRLRRQWFAVDRRERMVRVEELPRFYSAVDALPNPVARAYLLLLLFTGLRRSEAASLRWDDVDLVERVIRVPAARTKAGRKLDLPMSDFVRDLLVARRAVGKEKFIFPSDSEAGYIAEPKFPLTQVALACGVRISAHDLRRTFITVAEATDISPLALKALVNHSLGNGDVTAGYIQLTIERLREPMQRVTDRLKTLCGIVAPTTGGNVQRI
jgi:integrase